MENLELLTSFQTLPKNVVVHTSDYSILISTGLPIAFQDKLASFGSSWKHLCKYGNDDVIILERYGSNYWISYPTSIRDIDEIPKPLAELDKEPNTERPSKIIEFYKQEFLKILEEMDIDKTQAPVVGNLKLNMLPPDTTIENIAPTTYDPKAYLEIKYNESLFSTNNPLVYFVKSSLSRLRSMCKTTDKVEYLTLYKDNILEFFLDIDSFNKKHQGNKLIAIPSEKDTTEKNRRLYLQQLNVNLEEEEMVIKNDIGMLLKLREIKLQIILILELIIINDLDSKFVEFDKEYANRLKKRSLNLTKPSVFKSRRRVKIKLNEDKNTTELDNKKNKSDFIEQLDLYLDNLNILDILLASEPEMMDNENLRKIQEQKLNLMNKTKEASSVGFINYILIPFYNKRVPNAIKFIASKLKAPSLKSRENFGKSSSKNSLSDLQFDMKNFENGIGSSQSSSRYSSTPSSPKIKMPPFLKRTSTIQKAPNFIIEHSSSNLSEFLESKQSFSKPASLSRTNSDLSMLQKRQLSVTELATSSQVISTTSLVVSELPGNALKRSYNDARKQKSFRRVGKMKSTTTLAEMVNERPRGDRNSEEMVQVTATPLTKRREALKSDILNNIIESPVIAETSLSEGKIIQDSPYSSTQELATKVHSPNVRKKVKRRLFAPST
ncbi:hypothetical protein TPHA_0J01930 [Tetrapisispora phaffii CBS 4417]|uniref:DNA replication regulator Sld3 C-terminal domain-containing protein n=1 Tax=Tetrapisispora phaffii (strain ATCC 24235 / CBS 4417 / NBRC 1672 / NRRL Y-8282 / UCD 70-5) TaxID=1071381 RepID=G8BYS2_TETPH|nr:hypothetical protein TPHA_0J01930 [Tetrapisispora phaffii CBS 4417]CCE65014.1 hypothetical protein TPHA_0J01930 [Tetrapisispora phaffii CBS 4417]